MTLFDLFWTETVVRSHADFCRHTVGVRVLTHQLIVSSGDDFCERISVRLRSLSVFVWDIASFYLSIRWSRKSPGVLLNCQTLVSVVRRLWINTSSADVNVLPEKCFFIWRFDDGANARISQRRQQSTMTVKAKSITFICKYPPVSCHKTYVFVMFIIKII